MRAATREDDEPLNILTFPTHERFQSGLSGTNAIFYLFRSPQVKDWNHRYASLPENHVLLNPARGEKQLPPEVDFDLVLSQNKAGQFQIASHLSRLLHLPLVSLEHTLPMPDWGPDQLAYLKRMRGHVNVFISAFSREKWGWGPDEAVVIHHGVDTDTFSPNDLVVTKKRHVLSVVNQLRERLWCCGYDFWETATANLPRLHLGESPDGWSQPAKSVPDLVRHYREATVFVDTASASPIPTVLLEAMACGCVVVSRGNAMVSEVIQDGVNGFIRADAQSMRQQLAAILAAPEKFQAIGQAARRTIVERFGLTVFVKNWDRVLRAAADIIYTGESL